MRPLTAFAAVFVLTLSGCFSCPEALDSARFYGTLARADAEDPAALEEIAAYSPDELQLYLTEIADSWEAVIYLMDSDSPPSEGARARAAGGGE